MVLSYCRKSGSSSINQFLWQTCQIIGFQVSLLHSEKTWYLKNAKPINLKYTQHILHTTCKFRNMISPKYDKVKTNNFRLEFHGGILLFPRVKGHKKCSWKISQQNLFVFILYHSFINSSHWILCVFFSLSLSNFCVSLSCERKLERLGENF